MNDRGEMEKLGRVVAVENQFVWVEVQTRSECLRCAEGRGCGAANVSRIFGEKPLRLRLLNTCHAMHNDFVSINILRDDINRSALLMYGLPLFSFVGTAALLNALTLSEGVTVPLSLLALLAGFIPAYVNSNRVEPPRLSGLKNNDKAGNA